MRKQILIPVIMVGERYQTPAYANTGGTGDRTSIITPSTTQPTGGADSVTITVDGVTAAGDYYFNGAQAVAGNVMKFIFPNKVKITEAIFYSSSGSAGGSGVWRWQGSNDGTNWTNIGGTFTLATVHPQTQTTLAGNGVGYLQYRVLGVSGNIIAGGCYNREWEFKIGNIL